MAPHGNVTEKCTRGTDRLVGTAGVVRSHLGPKPSSIAPTVTPRGQNLGMARTHGTRSAYNAGCRCDECREASRVARARQRTVSQGRIARSEAQALEAEPPGGEAGLAVLGLLSLGAGGVSLWHGATMHPDEERDPESARRTRHRWILAGVVLLIIGAVALRAVAAEVT